VFTWAVFFRVGVPIARPDTRENNNDCDDEPGTARVLAHRAGGEDRHDQRRRPGPGDPGLGRV